MSNASRIQQVVEHFLEMRAPIIGVLLLILMVIGEYCLVASLP